MSVLKNLDINLSASSKKTLLNFLYLYTFFTLVITSLGIYMYYSSQKEIYNKEQLLALNEYANELTIQLKDLKRDTTGKLIYPWSKKFKTLLFDKRYKLVYSTKDNPPLDLTNFAMNQNMIARYLKNSDEYYLNAQYIIVEMVEDDRFTLQLMGTIIMYGFIFLVFMLLIGYYLLKLLLKPMEDTLFVLDRFIKDTTHELNTPVSTIVTNVELIQNKEHDKLTQKAIKRIEIGAKTLSNIYEDLTFLILKHKLSSHNENICLNEIVDERLEFFSSMATIKQIEINRNYKDKVTLLIDRKKLIKVIDNLLSNGIKYNKHQGRLDITITTNKLIIKDSGIGIDQKDLENLFTRYARFTNTTGGFGIGLHIVKTILDEYKIKIKVESTKGEYSSFILSF
ncbi:MAG TPA: HAMP domain-containing histidine kinase [Arcobacter sp.]|nr:HAMP domain-containing histidine kinase [Arcobacter sp.]